MGMNPLNIADAFLGVLAQRLVRRLCTECKEPFHPDKEEFDYIKKDYGTKAFKDLGVEHTSAFKLQRSLGCEKCNGSGYKGRLVIHELIEGTPDIKILIKKQATSQDLAKQAVKDGMTTLKQDGVHKVFEGVTDMSEIRRVCVT
jgi:type II secretory ATPase GspE/PulE/Tfp pilus assembly ATPase PilB-like protein